MTTYERLLQYAFRIISKKRYTIFEMKNKLAGCLKKYKIEGDEFIKAVINRLIELNYLNDGQFVKDYVSDRVKLKPRGLSLISRELRIKGIDKELIMSGIGEANINEPEIIQILLLKRKDKWNAFHIDKQRQKAYQLLASKGFKQDDIYRAIKTCYN